MVHAQIDASFGLTVRYPKTNIMATGSQVMNSDMEPINCSGRRRNRLHGKAPYLGSVVATSGGWMMM